MNHKRAYYRDIYGVRRDNIPNPYDEEEIDYTGYQAYEHYIKWANFQKDYPWNTELLKELFGERDAMEVYRYMQTIPEVKAKEIVTRLRQTVVRTGRLKNMSDC